MACVSVIVAKMLKRAVEQAGPDWLPGTPRFYGALPELRGRVFHRSLLTKKTTKGEELKGQLE